VTVEEIREYVQLFATAARNAVLGAGLDGVEPCSKTESPGSVFTDNTNERKVRMAARWDRARFVLEITEAVVQRGRCEQGGLRLRPVVHIPR